jgi:hypothetical protein
VRAKQASPAQTAFDFAPETQGEPVDPPAPQDAPTVQYEPTGRTLDAEGHWWWAALARESQENCIMLTNETAQGSWEAQEMVAAAKTWKGIATFHEANGNRLGSL